MSVTTTAHVQGMTCEHCVRAVHDELARLPGVTAVDVDLATGRVDVVADAPVDHDALRHAVDEAGYELAP
jgi:copper ion binding protein